MIIDRRNRIELIVTSALLNAGLSETKLHDLSYDILRDHIIIQRVAANILYIIDDEFIKDSLTRIRRVKQIRTERIVTSALLNSSLSENELVELSHDILSHGSIIYRIAENILSIIDDTLVSVRGSYSLDIQQEAKKAYIWLKAKGMTKDKIFKALSNFNEQMKFFIREESPTIKEAMEYFVSITSRHDFNMFMASFNDDDFIRVIEDK